MSIPLAEKLRPTSLDDFIGQEHLVGEKGIIRRMIESGKIPSLILWGPPGVGKTTLANIIASSLNVPFYKLSAVQSGVKDVREVLETAKKQCFFSAMPPILFIDEIHRFNKSQQDSLLHSVEKGEVTLIGATTENPSFEVIRPLLSRCQVYTLHSLNEEELRQLLNKALIAERNISEKKIEVRETDALFHFSGGDGRKLLNIIDLLITFSQSDPVVIDNEHVNQCLQEHLAEYDKNGEMHYDFISAFIKSIRGSDPDAALYWMARMIAGGEEPKFIARRLIILASEDIGLANPNALLMANACFDAVEKIGWPESRIILAQAAIYLATSSKSNSAYMGIKRAQSLVEKTNNLPVPLHLRNAPTQLMKDLGYHKNYIYPHDYKNNYSEQQYLPDEIADAKLWIPCDNPKEKQQADFLNYLKKSDSQKEK